MRSPTRCPLPCPTICFGACTASVVPPSCLRGHYHLGKAAFAPCNCAPAWAALAPPLPPDRHPGSSWLERLLAVTCSSARRSGVSLGLFFVHLQNSSEGVKGINLNLHCSTVSAKGTNYSNNLHARSAFAVKEGYCRAELSGTVRADRQDWTDFLRALHPQTQIHATRRLKLHSLRGPPTDTHLALAPFGKD